MASSTQDHRLHHLPTPCGTTTAPPPTPSTQPNNLSEASDSLSRLLHRIPPTLSLSFPGRRQFPPTTTASPPLISLSDPKAILHSNLLSAAKQQGFFQLTEHSISSHLAQSAESESLSIFNLSHDDKQLCFPKNWPLGFDNDDEDDDNVVGQSFCLDELCSVESNLTEMELTSLRKLTCQMEKLGLQVIEELSCAVGFENPIGEDQTRYCSLMWISESDGSSSNRPLSSGRLYPFAVGLTYQIRCRKYTMLADSGWVSVSPQVDSVMVTLGDIAQVWSNGKVKKVRGRPVPSSADVVEVSNCVSMTLLVTLPHDNTVSPLLPKSPSLAGGDTDETEVLNKEDDGLGENNSKTIEQEESPMFNSFSFEDYAWRVYHERLLFKDPLVRYRV
ncbi:hypothetical protein RND71_030639 [Anisodus tanguticus]|uniref:Non-haem dioxygenase N-terminal domain-containing protein n=1 Tax=Anisodus tanguticus TaxID=243964 RepID=A0AAE1V5P3_9SOLA|nr:hypothetical protein RND71_030639 [Anisodus tanguticus]